MKSTAELAKQDAAGADGRGDARQQGQEDHREAADRTPARRLDRPGQEAAAGRGSEIAGVRRGDSASRPAPMLRFSGRNFVRVGDSRMPPARDSLAVSGSSPGPDSGRRDGRRTLPDRRTRCRRTPSARPTAPTDISHRNAGGGARHPAARARAPRRRSWRPTSRTPARCVHKNLVEVLTVGREADFFFIATELLDGQTPARVHRRQARARGATSRSRAPAT